MNVNKKKSFINSLKPHRTVSGGGNIASTVYALLGIIVIQCIVIGINSGFGNILPKLVMSWMNVLRNNVYAGIMAIGMCFVIMSGGIDISVGSMMCAIGAFLMFLIDAKGGLLMRMGISGVPAYLIAVPASMLLGVLLGGLNGVLVSYCNIPPFIVTLGTMKIFRSVTQQLTDTFTPEVPEGFKMISSYKIGGEVILPILYWIIIVALLCFVLKKTVYGKQVTAIGSNERAAKFSGINVKKIKCRVYAICGLLCAAAAIIYVARIGSMDFSNAGSGYEMDAIAAVAVGGTAMSGGRGSVFGTFLGMLIISIMNNILNSVGVPTFLCDAVRGAIIIAAVLVQMKNRDK